MVLADAAGRSRTRRGRPHHPGRARPGLAGHPRHDRRGLRRRRRGRGRGPARHGATRRDILAARARATTAGSSSRRRSTPRSPSSTPTPPSTSRSTSSRSSRPSPASATPGSLFVGPWAPESAGDYATGANHVLPTGGLARASGGARGRGVRQVHPGPADRPRRPRRRSAPRSRTLAEAEGLHAHRDAVEIRFEDRSADEPDAGHLQPADRAGAYSWEATDEEVAARYGLDPSSDRPVRPQHLARPAGARRSGCSRPAGSRRRCPSTRRPTTAAWSRPPRPATASTATRSSSGPAPTRSSTSSPRRSSRPAAAAVVPTPTYAMYRVLTEQRGATVVAVPRSARTAGWALDLDADARRRRATPPSSGCAARTTRPRWPSRTARSRRCSTGSPRTPPRTAGPPPSSSSTRPTPSSSGRSLVGLRDDYPNLDRRPDREQGLRAGRPAGRLRGRPPRADRRGSNPYRPPGSVSTVSVTLVDRGAARSRRSSTPTSPASPASATRLRDAPARASAGRVGPSVTNFLLVDFGSAERAATVAEALLRRGLVPRTFGAGHPLADHLRLTVRDPHENDRLIAAAADARHGGHRHDHAARRHRRSVRARAVA